ncbi:MAG TPA: hypothetical protein VGV85_02235 [Longimicrobiaceae bacterium]|nr:hypothetical protein [Longimicrobiaceae bacterium]
MIRSRSARRASLLSMALLLGATSLHAQIGGALRGAASRLGERLPDVSGMVQGKAPITTSLQDAKWAVDSLDNFRPRESFRNIAQLQRTPNGGFVLQPGAYSYQAQSYCLKAGTHGPGGGDGYLFAPPIGPAEEAVMTIVRNSVQHPEIHQHDIQTLLWAIIARAKFEDLSTEHKAVASRLLTPRQLASLNRSALDLIPGPALDRAMASMPPLVRQVVEAEAKLRQMLINPATSFQQLEAVAVLSGAVGLGPGSREVPSGRWSMHPDGYYVRYIPSGYSSTRVEVWVPQGSPAVGKEFDPASHIAVPGNTSRQRLIQSARMQQAD